MHFSLVLKRLLPPLVGLISLIFLLHAKHDIIDQWFAGLSWLSLVSLIIAGLIAAQFGRSRIVFCCLLLVSFYATQHGFLTLLKPHTHVLLVTSVLAVSWLIWRKDKGLLPLNALSTALEISAFALLVIYSFVPLSQLADPFFAGVSQYIYVLIPELVQLFSPFELVLYALLVISSLSRLVLQPTNSHIGIFLTLLVLLISLTNYQQPKGILVNDISLLALAIYYVLAVLTDSFNMAFRDELSGIPSRRALMQYVQTLGRKYVVVMADIDHFKKFNDTYGHDVGDQVLKLVASQLNKVSGGGKAFRYGGEEFTLIFPRKSINQVIPHIEVIRQSIADYDIVLRGQDRPTVPPKKNQAQKPAKSKTVSVTCSFGVAQRSPEVTDFSSIIKQADVALYAAKKAGRNCVQQAKS